MIQRTLRKAESIFFNVGTIMSMAKNVVQWPPTIARNLFAKKKKNDFSLAFLGNKSRSPQKFPARKSSGGMGG